MLKRHQIFIYQTLKAIKSTERKGNKEIILFYQETFQKDESFINIIGSITINMRENDESLKDNFCLAKDEFLNIIKRNNQKDKLYLVKISK